MSTQFKLFALALALLQGCAPSVPQQEPMRSVKLITVQASQASSSTGWSAEVRARHEARLSFRTGGQLIQRPLGLGARFKAGQVLAELDPQDQGLGVQAAQAQRLAAQAQYDLALSDFKRYETLFAQGFIGSAEMDRRRTAWQAAQAQLEQARVQADLQINQARYTRLIPDRPGIVIGIDAEPGKFWRLEPRCCGWLGRALARCKFGCLRIRFSTGQRARLSRSPGGVKPGVSQPGCARWEPAPTRKRAVFWCASTCPPTPIGLWAKPPGFGRTRPSLLPAI